MAIDRGNEMMDLRPDSARNDAEAQLIEIPYTTLSPGALRGVLESVVLREGTDYGEREYTLEQKLDELSDRLRRGEVQIVFEVRSQTVDIRPIDRNLNR